MATAPQLAFIASLISERDWHNAAPGYARRVATISATLYIAEQVKAGDVDPAHILTGELSNPTDVAVTFSELMAASRTNAERNRDAAIIADRKPLTKRGASALIDWLQGQPVQTHAASVATSTATNAAHTSVSTTSDPGVDVVPAGRYAIDTADGATNATAFYRVDRPTEGRWAGRVFVKLITGGDEQRLSWATTKAVLVKIADAGAEMASARYGHEIGRCGICHTRLTNDVSRARGIGPKCAAKSGW